MPTNVPRVLYKYRQFSENTVELLCEDSLYYASPSTFNDPMESRPCVETDCDLPTLRQAVFELVRRRESKEMIAGASAIKYRGPKTMAHIDKLSKNVAARTLENLDYMATDPEFNEQAPGPIIWLLGQEMERELLLQYDKGVLSLAKRYNCPLMWSHYGDQHQGICIGYSVPEAAMTQLHAVKYGGQRRVMASQVAAMLNGDLKAQEEVDRTVLLQKAQDWRYEKEWRMLGSRGLADSPLEMVEVCFGLRCTSAVKYTVSKALRDREKDIRMYEMHEVRGTFLLKRRLLDEGELSARYPRRALSVGEDFDAIEGEE